MSLCRVAAQHQRAWRPVCLWLDGNVAGEPQRNRLTDVLGVAFISGKGAPVLGRPWDDLAGANDDAMRVVSGGPEAQACVDDPVEVTRVGEIAFEDADRVVDPLRVLRVEAMERRAVPKVPG